jgi:molybdopterin molybdotransferase
MHFMIAFGTAYEIALNSAFQLPVERLELAHSQGRILAEDIHSDTDLPPFDKSAVDGFACKLADITSVLQLIETIPAGKFPEKTVITGTCSKIMTGAPIPQGADCVVMVEESEEMQENSVRFRISKTASNIRYKGEDVKAGQLLIPAGTLIQAGHVAVMATAGYSQPQVYSLPRIAILSTGDELVEPDQKPGPSEIRNSNAYQLLAQCARMGITAEYCGIARDNEQETLAKILNAVEVADVILITGGVSMGDFDHVPAIMQKAGLEVLFRKVAIQPGRPTVLAKKEGALCFGLPGNPVSSFVLFEMLVKPVLYRMMGHTFTPITVKLEISSEYKRKRADRMNVLPVRINNLQQAELTEYHGSAHIQAMTATQGFLCVEEGIQRIDKGSLVNVRLL